MAWTYHPGSGTWYDPETEPEPPSAPPGATDDVPEWQPPTTDSGQPSGGTQGGWFPVGYGGTDGGVGTPTGGGGWSSGGSFGFPPGSPQWQAAAGAYEQSQQAAQDALKRLAPGQFLGGGYGGALGNMAMDRYKNTPGFDPAAMQAQRTALTSQEAGSRENMLRTMNERAQASGFGDSMNLVDAEQRARSQSAQNLSSGLNQLEWMNQQARMQREATSAGLLGNLANAESGYGLAYAASQMGRQFPAIPGVTPGPGGQGGYGGTPIGSGGQPAWSQSGQYMPGGYGYDPYTPPTTGSGAPTGYSPQQPWSPW
jgi:hypothetical protein